MKFTVMKPIYAFLDVDAETQEEAIRKAMTVPNYMWQLTENILDAEGDYSVTA